MNNIHSLTSALHLTLSLLALWYLFYRAFSEYRVDALRERLFALREELFDYAADGHVEFDHPAYGRLRQLVNGLIRFAHRMTFLRAAFGVLFYIFRPNTQLVSRHREEWTKELLTQPIEVQKKLWTIHNRALFLVLRHMVIGSPVLFPIVCILMAWAYCRGLRKRGSALATDLPGVEIWEEQVLEADHEERLEEEVFA